jgi:hypothetical protein
MSNGTDGTATAHYNLIKPVVGGSATTWGTTLNDDLDKIDAQLFLGAGALNVNGLTLANSPGTGVAGSITFINATVPTGQQTRWVLAEGTSAETGGGAGSNLSLAAYNDSGILSSTPIAINRASGTVTFGTPVNFSALATFANLTSTGTATFVTVNGTGTATFATLNATTSTITTLNVTTLHVSGAGNVNGGLTVSNGLNVTSGSAVFGAGVTVSAGGLNVTGGAATFAGGVNGATSFNSTITLAGQLTGNTANFSGSISVNQLGLPSGGYITAPPGQSLQTDAGGNWVMIPGSGGNFLLEAGNGYKPGGGAWASLSDERVKTVVEEYEPGLDEVLQLRPVVYTYNGNDTATADGVSPHRHAAETKKEFVGLVAQELETIFPDMVSKHEGYIDGERVSDIRDVDTSALLYALVNCVKELKAEIEALKK